MKPFEKWRTEEVELTFGVSYKEKMQLMDDWLAFGQELTAEEIKISEKLRLFLVKFANFWNEEDMKMFFIAQIIQMVDFYLPGKYRTFMEATFKVEMTDVNDTVQSLRGRAEMVVATGKQDPQTPFFFLNEYKAQTKVVTDPRGQLLIAMLAAQTKNKGLNLPVYGMYNIGQFWFALVLSGKEYSATLAFDATDAADLKRIINMLQFVKAHIERNV